MKKCSATHENASWMPMLAVFLGSVVLFGTVESWGASVPNVKVPDVVGQTTASASQILKAAGFKAQTGASTSTSNHSQDGIIAAQNPSAGQTVAKGTVVTLTPFKFKSLDQMKVPNVVGRTTASANQILSAAGFKVTFGASISTSIQSQDLTVAAQSPAAGQPAAKGTTVTLTPFKFKG